MANQPDDPTRPDDPNQPARSSGEPTPRPAKRPPTAAKGTDSSIDLGSASEGIDIEQAPVIPWGSLSEKAPDTGIARGSAAEDALVADLEDSGIDLGEAVPAPPVPSFAPLAEDSGIDLSQPVVVEDVPAAQTADESSAIDLGQEAVVVEERRAPLTQISDDSAIDLDDDVVVVEGTPPLAGSDAEIDMGPRSAVLRKGQGVTTETPSSIDLAGEAASSSSLRPDSGSAIDLGAESDSGVDLITAPSSAAVGGTAPLTSDSGIDFLDDDVILDDPPAKSATGSGRDLIAEQVESGILSPPAARTDDALEEFLSQAGVVDQSSSVDLGSRHSVDVIGPEDYGSGPPAAGPTGADSGVRIDRLDEPAPAVKRPARVDLESESEIDLPPVEMKRPSGKKPTGMPVKAATDVDIDMSPAAAVEEDEAPVTPPPKKAEPKPGGRGGLLVGAAGGLLLGAAACVGVWAFGIEPPEALRDLTGSAKPKAARPGGPAAGAASKEQLDAARAAQFKDVADRLAKGAAVTNIDELEKAIAAENKKTLDRVDELTRQGEAQKKTLDETREGEKKAVADRKAAETALAKEKVNSKTAIEERKKAVAQVGELTRQNEAQKKDLETARAGMKKSEADKVAAEKALLAGKAREKGLEANNADALAALREIGEALGSKFTNLKASRDDLVKTARETKRAAGVADPTGAVQKLERTVSTLQAQLESRRPAAEMLPLWRAHLRQGGDQGAEALKDANRVLADARATEAHKAQAQYVRGLALRQQGKYAEAKTALGEAQTALAQAKSPWVDEAAEAVRDAADPGAGLARRARELAARGQAKEAVSLLEGALKGAEKKGSLYAQRARISLEAARGRRSVNADDPAVRQAEADARAAAKEGVAEGHYVLGQLAELQGNYAEAVKNYRAALAAHGDLRDAARSRYVAALAWALQRARANEPAARTSGVRPPLNALHWLVLFTVQDGLPSSGPRDSEADKLADEILQNRDKEPFDAVAKALLIKGRYTEALEVYTNGLRAAGLLAPEYANGLRELIDAHPGLRRPTSRTQADPLAGERHYGTGLNAFAARRYRDAERAFLAAVENDGTDARYYYYLGLARLAQNKRDAHEDFEQASRLERAGRPSSDVVSRALERVQGPMRRALNEVRNRLPRDSN